MVQCFSFHSLASHAIFCRILDAFVRQTVQSPDFVYSSGKYWQWRYVIVNSSETVESLPSHLIRLINKAPFCCRSWLTIWLSHLSQIVSELQRHLGTSSLTQHLAVQSWARVHIGLSFCSIFVQHLVVTDISGTVSHITLSLHILLWLFSARHYSVVHFCGPWRTWKWIIRVTHFGGIASIHKQKLSSISYPSVYISLPLTLALWTKEI